MQPDRRKARPARRRGNPGRPAGRCGVAVGCPGRPPCGGTSRRSGCGKSGPGGSFAQAAAYAGHSVQIPRRRGRGAAGSDRRCPVGLSGSGAGNARSAHCAPGSGSLADCPRPDECAGSHPDVGRFRARFAACQTDACSFAAERRQTCGGRAYPARSGQGGQCQHVSASVGLDGQDARYPGRTGAGAGAGRRFSRAAGGAVCRRAGGGQRGTARYRDRSAQTGGCPTSRLGAGRADARADSGEKLAR